jgi:hypothetical protein
MSIQAVLSPLFVQVVLTLALLLWSSGIRANALRRGDVKQNEVALREPNWPAHILRVSNAYQNELELPLLFYVLTILAMMTRQADRLFVLLAWLFVALRLMHVYVHVTSNQLALRGSLFIAGAIVLAVMWGIFIMRILIGP